MPGVMTLTNGGLREYQSPRHLSVAIADCPHEAGIGTQVTKAQLCGFAGTGPLVRDGSGWVRQERLEEQPRLRFTVCGDGRQPPGGQRVLSGSTSLYLAFPLPCGWTLYLSADLPFGLADPLCAVGCCRQG